MATVRAAEEMNVQRFGKYEIIGKIGQGAMGEVFRARDTALNRDVALKTIMAGDNADETLQKRFHREAQSAACLSHPNIITIFDFDQEHGRLYMAMELLEGADLKAAIAGRTLRTLDDKLAVLEQIAAGLAFAHQNGVVHRDLKPANIHLQADGTVKIMDFGLAKMSGSDMTRTGMVMGTPHYMSPEQVRGERADTRSDVFSFGCIVYEVLTSAKPFDADSMHAVLFKVLQEQPRPVRELTPDTPLVLAQLVEGCLAKEPAHRLKDAAAALEALQAARQAIDHGKGNQPLPNLPLPAPPSAKARRPAASGADSGSGGSKTGLVVAVGAVGVLLALGLGAFLVLGKKEPAAALSSTPSPGQQKLAQALAGNQLELARKKLAARDYKDALNQAERALGLDPDNAEARKVAEQARKILAERETVAAAARQAAAAGDRRATATALWTLLQLEPASPVVEELSGPVEAEFESYVAEARRLMDESRTRAEKAGLSGGEEFREATRLMREADSAAKARRFASATRHLMAARDRLDLLLGGHGVR
jgi:serine/threonine-protein kinase